MSSYHVFFMVRMAIHRICVILSLRSLRLIFVIIITRKNVKSVTFNVSLITNRRKTAFSRRLILTPYIQQETRRASPRRQSRKRSHG